jgi:phosphate/sulfate permease
LDPYLLLVILLAILAVSDLVVGVSNDAVNFLNSAIGSKVAKRQTIMMVASAGILIGASLSGGMMEVARKGVFHPGEFFFDEIMILFVAVMLTDIFLLDLFNTFGLPTSTTVSIVFELLGASVVLAILKVSENGQSLSNLDQYINGSNALLIILGIFLSILFAFTLGALVQYISRLIFSFSYQKAKTWVTALWVSLAFSAMLFFLFIKGLKGASFMSEDLSHFIAQNKALLFLSATAILFVVFFSIKKIKDVNLFRGLVLFGTFSLAMAFAGNDLVNFIGVPVAGFESYVHWSATDTAPSAYAMGALNNAIPAQTYLLVIAGLIMIATLWFSKKAQSVTETEVNLGRQDEGLERFTPNILARGLVYYTHLAAKGIGSQFPKAFVQKINSRFIPAEIDKKEEDAPAFDLIRAAINLTMASVLIAFATSLKLPLSTTYVSFMVAMGTSLADKAWGRESAVYRISGVLSVVGGWFVTALVAFSVSAIFALCIQWFGLWFVLVILAVVATTIFFSFRYHKQKTTKKEAIEQIGKSVLTEEELSKEFTQRVFDTINNAQDVLNTSIAAVNAEDRKLLKAAKKELNEVVEDHEQLGVTLFKYLKMLSESNSHTLVRLYDYEQDLVQSCKLVFEVCENHLRNTHEPLQQEQQERLNTFLAEMDSFTTKTTHSLSADSADIEHLKTDKTEVLTRVNQHIAFQMEGIKQEQFNALNTELFLSILLEAKDIVAVLFRMVREVKKLG